MEADRMAAPQGPCPLSGGARLTGIESRDDAPPPHGNAAWRGGEERKKRFAERSRAKRSFTKAQAGRPWTHAAFARVEHGRPLRQRMLPQGESGTSPVSADNVGSPENQSPAARQGRDPLPIFGAFRQAGFTPEAGAPPPGGDSGLFILDVSDVHAAFQFGKLRRLPELGLALLPGLLQTGALHGLALNPRFLQHLVPPLFEGQRGTQ